MRSAELQIGETVTNGIISALLSNSPFRSAFELPTQGSDHDHFDADLHHASGKLWLSASRPRAYSL